MKQSEKFVLLLVLVIIFIGSFPSCSDNSLPKMVANTENEKSIDSLQYMLDKAEENHMTGRLGMTNYCGAEIKPGENKPFPGEITHGLPNETIYKFYVANPDPDIISVDIEFSAPDTGKYIHSMQKNSAGNWYLEKKLQQAGHYTLKYRLYKASGDVVVKTPNPSYVDNTRVHYSGGVLRIVWPFGYEDGSSWNDKKGWRITCENGCNKHKGKTYYALDWCKHGGCNGKDFVSPVDGIVFRDTPYDGGLIIGIRQVVGNVSYRFAVNHLQSIAPGIKKGVYVKAGETVLGKIGRTGASAPHAHTQVKREDDYSIPFDFSAQ